MDASHLKMLGLPPDATDDEISEKLASLGVAAHERDELRTQVSQATAAATAATDTLSSLRAEAEQREAQRIADEIKSLDATARSRGLWEPGSSRQTHFIKLAEIDVALAREYVGVLAPQNPVGGNSQANGVEQLLGMSAPSIPDGFGQLSSDYPGLGSVEFVPGTKLSVSEVYVKSFKSMGVTPKLISKFGPVALARAAEAEGGDDWSRRFRNPSFGSLAALADVE